VTIKSKGENERREFVLNVLESKAIIKMCGNTKKMILIDMKFDAIEVFQNALYKSFSIPIDTLFS